MLTPAFELNQDHVFLYFEIRAPFAKVSETEIFVEEKEFKFYSKPYYLRLSLPGAVVEDGREAAKYDTDSGTFNIKFPKAKAGEVFQGLDLITKLLAPPTGKSAQQPLIEVLETDTSSSNEAATAESHECQDEDDNFDWLIEQEPYKEDLDVIKLDVPKYGFASQRSGVLQRIQSEIPDVVDLADADSTPACKRRELRLADEQQQFDEDYYLNDLHQTDAITGLLQYTPPWAEEYRRIQADAEEEDIVKFTDEEKYKMRKLPRKEYLLDVATKRKVLLGLVDIIFAYCYDHRTTEGENTVESGWTIAKLSATLSWLDTYSSLRDCLVSCYRRCLCYPLYRHWKLTRAVHRDTVKIFSIGRRRLLKCLLEIHDLCQQSDSRYVLNDLYITDYCVWLQSTSSKCLDSLVHDLVKVKVLKKNLYLDVDVLEQAAELALSEDQGAASISLADLHINEADCRRLRTDREVQLTEQMRQLSMQKAPFTADPVVAGVASELSDSDSSATSQSASDESSNESSDESSEYMTASEDTDSDDTEADVPKAMSQGQQCGQRVRKPLITDITEEDHTIKDKKTINTDSVQEKSMCGLANDGLSLNF